MLAALKTYAGLIRRESETACVLSDTFVGDIGLVLTLSGSVCEALLDIITNHPTQALCCPGSDEQDFVELAL